MGSEVRDLLQPAEHHRVPRPAAVVPVVVGDDWLTSFSLLSQSRRSLLHLPPLPGEGRTTKTSRHRGRGCLGHLSLRGEDLAPRGRALLSSNFDPLEDIPLPLEHSSSLWEQRQKSPRRKAPCVTIRPDILAPHLTTRHSGQHPRPPRGKRSSARSYSSQQSRQAKRANTNQH